MAFFRLNAFVFRGWFDAFLSGFCVMLLNEISDFSDARGKRKRRGRGMGSGLGKTGGRGGKGQTARSGGEKAGFEGGQTPIYRRLPKRGFKKPNRLSFNEVTIFRIQGAIDSGKLPSSGVIDLPALIEAGLVRRALDGVRILGGGELKAPLSFRVNHVTQGARKIIESLGGSVELVSSSAGAA